MTRAVLAVGLGVALAGVCAGQTKPDNNPRKGLVIGASYALDDVERINRVNGNLSFGIPLGSLPPGRAGFSHGIQLVYNSKLWEPASQREAPVPLEWFGVRNSPDGGWRYGTGYELELRLRPIENSTPCAEGNETDRRKYRFKLRIVFPDGSKRLLRLRGYTVGTTFTAVDDEMDGYYQYKPDGKPAAGDSCYSAPPAINGKLIFFTTDGTFARLEVEPDADTNPLNNPWTLYLPDGGKVEGGNQPGGGYRPQKLIDRNGNGIRIEHTLLPSAFDSMQVTKLIDDLSREVTISYGTGTAREDVVAAPGVGGTTLQWKVTWTAASGNTNRTSTCTSSVTPPSGTTCPLESITLPGFSVTKVELPNSTNFNFLNSGTWGEVSKMTTPLGAEVTYAYSLDGTTTTSWSSLLGNYPVSKTVKYQWEGAAVGTLEPAETSTLSITPTESTFTGPDGGRMKSSFYRVAYDGSAQDWNSGLVYTEENLDAGIKVERVWKRNELCRTSGAGCNQAGKWGYLDDPSNPYVEKETVTEGTRFAAKTMEWDRNGNLRQVKEANWDDAGTAGLTHRTIDQTYQVAAALASSTKDAANSVQVYYDESINLFRLSKQKKITGGGTATQEDYCYDLAGNLRYLGRLVAGTPAGSVIDCLNGAVASPAGGSAIKAAFTYGAYGNPLTETDPRGTITNLEYDANSLHVKKKTLAFGQSEAKVTEYWPDSTTGVLQTIKEANGAYSVFDYDSYGRETGMAAGAKCTAPPCSVSTATNALRKRTTVYSDSGRYVMTTEALDGTRDLVTVDHFDQLGRVWLTRSSETGSLTGPITLGQAVPGIKVETRYRRNGTGSYVLRSNPYRGSWDTSDTETMGWTITELDKGGREVRVETFGGVAQPAPWGASVTSRGKLVTSYSGIKYQVCDEAASASAPPAANPGACRTMERDSAGRIAKVTEWPAGTGSTGYETTYGYNALDKVTSVSQGALAARTYIYDALGRLTKADNPESGEITYVFDANGNLLEREDARIVSSTPTVKKVKLCFGTLTNATCDGLGYDRLNRPVKKTYTDSTPAVTYTYDQDLRASGDTISNYYEGQLVKIQNTASETTYRRIDGLGRVDVSEQVTGGKTYKFEHTYDAAGHLTSLKYPSGKLVSYSYDSAGRPSTVNGPGGSTYWAKETGTDPTGGALLPAYAAHGGLHLGRLGNGVLEVTRYNDRLQPIRIEAATGSGTGMYASLLKLSYGYSAAANNGNPISQTIIQNGATIAQVYEFDRLNRVKKVTETVTGSTAISQTFVYDQYGNRALLSGSYYLTASSPAFVATDTASAVASIYSKNRVALDVADATGNITSWANGNNFTFDAENRMTCSARTAVGGCSSAVKPVQYFYDGAGRRVKKLVAGSPDAQTIFVYDGLGQLAVEEANFVPAGVTDGLRYMTVDSLGSTRLVTGGGGSVEARYDYLPFGEDLGQGVSGRATGYPLDAMAPANLALRFTSKERDAETGLDYFGARYMSSAQGRFTSVDPALDSAKPDDPQTWNRYAYVGNNPLRYVDPDGRERMEAYQNQIVRDLAAGRINREQARQRLTEYAPPAVGIAGTVVMVGATAAVAAPEIAAGGLLTGLVNWVLGNPGRVQQAGEIVVDAVAPPGMPSVSTGAYDVAAAGGRHAGFLKNYLGKSAKELDKGIASIEKEIATHFDKIKNPGKYIEGFGKLDPRQQKALVQQKWPSDIARQQEQLDILKRLREQKEQ